MRFLVIGLGSIGTRHANNLVAMGHEVAGYDPDKNIEQGIIQDGWDGVVIASPTSTHKRYLDDAVDYGHNVFVEKPIAESSAGLQGILDSAKSRGIVVMVGNNLRFHGCVKKAKEWIDNKAIGHPIWAQFMVAQLSKKETYLQDGVISNWGAHELDLARYLLGECVVLSCVGNEEMADIILQHTNGCQTTVHLDYLTEPEQRQFSITGHKGSFFANLVTRRMDVHQFRDTFDDNYKEEMQAFIDMIGAMAKPGEELNEAAVLRLATGLRWSKIAASGGDGLAVLRLIEKAKELAS